MRTATHCDHEPLPETFAEMNAVLPLRPIHDRIGLDNAMEVVERLIVLPRRNADQEDYLESLSTLIETYETDIREQLAAKASPVEVLRSLMEGVGMNASDLGKLLGDRTLGPKILNGGRGLSQAHIRKLCERFRVKADLFI